jgi:hypothetical protein
MRNFRAVLLAPLAVAFALLAVGPVDPAAAAPPAPAGATAQDDPGGAARLLELINADRAAAGLGLLRSQGELSRIANEHSQRMAAAGSIWHNDALFTPAVKQLVGAVSVGENVAFESGGMTRAHWMLMQSPGHRANIMNPRFDAVGIAVAVTGDGIAYLTQAFAQTGGAAPAPAPAPVPVPSPAPVPAPAPPVTAPPAPPTTVAPPTTASPTTAPPTTVAPPTPTSEAPAGAVDEEAIQASAVEATSATPASIPRATAVSLPAVALLALVNLWLARWAFRSWRSIRAGAPLRANARPR